jgi:histidinol phosphatase-like PHP family hydrolase
MIDLHTHTFYSDGVLVPAELVRRAAVAGYRCIGITDHADSTNLEAVVTAALEASAVLEAHCGIAVVPGVELTHIPPPVIPEMVSRARKIGARLVVVHGETLVEPVAEGTNRMAITAGADILSHPGLISLADARRAAKKGVFLEVTARKGHCLANGHVVATARKAGASVIFGTDSHSPEDLVPRRSAERMARGSGLQTREIKRMFADAEKLVRRIHGRLQRHG